jgi:hypothetical protein
MTIYEIFEEKANRHAELIKEYARQCYLVSEENHPIEDAIKAYNDVMNDLRQSFIAMVEGEKEELRERIKYIQNIYTELPDTQIGVEELKLQISRLESELLKLKEN